MTGRVEAVGGPSHSIDLRPIERRERILSHTAADLDCDADAVNDSDQVDFTVCVLDVAIDDVESAPTQEPGREAFAGLPDVCSDVHVSICTPWV